jgi:predicted adenylyl cyclase CyaB
MSWYEVESKVKINDYKVVESFVKSIAQLKGRDVKNDSYFSLYKSGYPHKAFRVRDNGKSFVINFKTHNKSLYSKNVVVKEEFEFCINSKPELDNFLALCKDLGFKKWITKKKTTTSYSYNADKRLTIELNDVAGLGYWMELEYLCSKKEVPRAKKLIDQVLTKITSSGGLGSVDNTGYTKMLYKKRSN